MTKNITLSIPDRIGKEMEKMPEINWSAVARKCIEQYIERRKNPDVSSLLEKLQRQQGEEYVKGRRKAEEIADRLGYSELNLLMRKYQEEVDDTNVRAMQGPEEPWDHLPSRNDIMQNLLVGKGIIKEASDEFLRGIRERLREIEDSMSKKP